MKTIKDAISLIARTTGNLEKFKYICKEPLQNGTVHETFKELVDSSNKALRSVQIHLSDARSMIDAKSRIEHAADILKTCVNICLGL